DLPRGLRGGRVGTRTASSVGRTDGLYANAVHFARVRGSSVEFARAETQRRRDRFPSPFSAALRLCAKSKSVLRLDCAGPDLPALGSSRSGTNPPEEPARSCQLSDHSRARDVNRVSHQSDEPGGWASPVQPDPVGKRTLRRSEQAGTRKRCSVFPY